MSAATAAPETEERKFTEDDGFKTLLPTLLVVMNKCGASVTNGGDNGESLREFCEHLKKLRKLPNLYFLDGLMALPPLLMAARQLNVKAVEVLLDGYVSPFSASDNGVTAINAMVLAYPSYLPSCTEKVDQILKLIAAAETRLGAGGQVINCKDKLGATALALAVSNGVDLQFLECLVLNGADIKQTVEYSVGFGMKMTVDPRDLALRLRKMEIAKWLEDYAATVINDPYPMRQELAMKQFPTAMNAASLIAVVIATVAYNSWTVPPAGLAGAGFIITAVQGGGASGVGGDGSAGGAVRSMLLRVFFIMDAISFFTALCAVMMVVTFNMPVPVFTSPDKLAQRGRRFLAVTSSLIMVSVASLAVAYIISGFAVYPPAYWLPDMWVIAAVGIICIVGAIASVAYSLGQAF